MEEIKKRLRSKEIEISKHRKLLHRAVGNHVLPYINYHHFEIVRLIGELEVINREYDRALRDHPLMVMVEKGFIDMYLKLEDQYILTGINLLDKPTSPPASSHTS